MTPSERDHLRRQLYSLNGRVANGFITPDEMTRLWELKKLLSEQPGLRADGRPNHKPIIDYCPDLPQLPDHLAIASYKPRDADQEAEISAAVWEIAAQIRGRHMPGAAAR